MQSTHENKGEPKFAKGTPIMRPMSASTLRERLTRYADWTRYDARTKKDVPTLPPMSVVSALMDRGEWPGVRELVGIAETPVVRPDGSICEAAGYDAVTRYVYRPSADYLAVPSRPTEADAAHALTELAEVFCDFPYSTDAARLVPIAHMISIMARPMITGPVPMFLYDAPAAGSGKTLQTDGVVTIATGRGANRMSWPSDETELEKVLGAYGLRGAANIVFDNVGGARTLAGAPLDKVLTAEDRVELRVLGRSEIPIVRWRAVLAASGNNMTITGDTVRRVLVARIEPREERPEDRSGFAHPDLLAWVRAERPRLVRAALTMIRAWVVAGRPRLVPGTWGSFEAWTATIAQVLAFAGGANVLGARLDPSEARAGDPLAALLPLLLDALERLDEASRGTSVRALLGLLYPPTERHAPRPPDGFDDLRSALEAAAPPRPGAPPDAVRVGHALRRLRGRVLGGRRLATLPLSQTKNVAHWTVERV